VEFWTIPTEALHFGRGDFAVKLNLSHPEFLDDTNDSRRSSKVGDPNGAHVGTRADDRARFVFRDVGLFYSWPERKREIGGSRGYEHSRFSEIFDASNLDDVHWGCDSAQQPQRKEV
jgi:hypothetical protein